MIEKLRKKIPEVQENTILAPFTSFKIGGPAKYFFIARSADEMAGALTAAVEYGIPFFIMAGGSNILVSDKGFDGLVVLNAIKGFHSEIRDGQAVVTAGAGESWDGLVAHCVAQEWAGIECLSGIPGTVGAAPVQNIGAYGQSVGDVVESVEVLDTSSRRDESRVIFNNAQCEFGYRTSVFKRARGRFSITRVTLALNPGGAPLLAYHDLKQYFGHAQGQSFVGEGLSLGAVRKAVIAIRAKKGYVIMPEYESYKTAGSFFTNPVIAQDQFQKLLPLIHGCPDPWYWPLENGRVKVSAACLLQSAGFSKGYRKGNVGISPKHALSIVNFANASASEVMALAQDIKTRVQEKFGIFLEEEVQFVGF